MRLEFLFTLLMVAQLGASQRCQDDTLLVILRSNQNEAVPFCRDFLRTVWKTVVVTNTVTTIVGTSTKQTTSTSRTTSTQTNTDTETSTLTERAPTITITSKTTTTTTSFTPNVKKRQAAAITGHAFSHVLEGFAPRSLSSACTCLRNFNTAATVTRTKTETRKATKLTTSTTTSKTTTTTSITVTTETTTTTFTIATIPTTTTTSTTSIQTTIVPKAFKISFTTPTKYYVGVIPGSLQTLYTSTSSSASIFHMTDPFYIYLGHIPESGPFASTLVYSFYSDVPQLAEGVSLAFASRDTIDSNAWGWMNWNLNKDAKTLSPYSQYVPSGLYTIYCSAGGFLLGVTSSPGSFPSCMVIQFSVEWVDDYW